MNAMTPEQAYAHAAAVPLDQIDLSDGELFKADTIWPYMARLRREDPIHYHKESKVGPFWSVTRFNDIMAVDTNHEVFSSDYRLGGITLFDAPHRIRRPSFISLDPPVHDEQRKVVSPIVAPMNLAKMSVLIRERVCTILDSLPRNETFNWVDKVSIELTTQMLATLFDFPFEDRRKLTYWSDVATTIPTDLNDEAAWDKRNTILFECLAYFTKLRKERENLPPSIDLISMLAHSPNTRNMSPEEFLGNLILLIVGGNDTTRNTISASVLLFNRNPGEYQKLVDNPKLLPNAVSEVIRYHTPLSHMRRTALRDFELGGKTIKKGDKVAMWYISGNRDETVIENPDAFLIDRARARQHLSFGFGVHRCVGNRLAEMQLNILWEEMLKRFGLPQLVGPEERLANSFVHGITNLPVRIPG